MQGTNNQFFTTLKVEVHMTDLSGKVALVTGGSRGIGAEIARRLARDGAHVAITFRENANAAKAVVADIERLGRKAVAFQADAADAITASSIIDRVVDHFGRVDILVNNAGYMDTSGTELGEITLDVVDRTIMVNVRAAFLHAQSASNHLSDGGRVINIGSCLGGRVPGSGLTLYSMTKSAITGLTKGLARDLASRGITVNQVSPAQSTPT